MVRLPVTRGLVTEMGNVEMLGAWMKMMGVGVEMKNETSGPE